MVERAAQLDRRNLEEDLEMATQLTIYVSDVDGQEATPVANPSGDYAIPNAGQDGTLVVDNQAGAVGLTVDVNVQRTVKDLTVPDRAQVAVPAGDVFEFGPYDAETYNVKSGADANHWIATIGGGDASSRIWARRTAALE